MSRLPISRDDYLDVLFRAQLLCEICEERPWSTHGRWHHALLCDDCAATQPAQGTD